MFQTKFVKGSKQPLMPYLPTFIFGNNYFYFFFKKRYFIFHILKDSLSLCISLCSLYRRMNIYHLASNRDVKLKMDHTLQTHQILNFFIALVMAVEYVLPLSTSPLTECQYLFSINMLCWVGFFFYFSVCFLTQILLWVKGKGQVNHADLWGTLTSYPTSSFSPKTDFVSERKKISMLSWDIWICLHPLSAYPTCGRYHHRNRKSWIALRHFLKLTASHIKVS